jgi:N-acetylglucosamine-6-phosphate deacetylase
VRRLRRSGGDALLNDDPGEAGVRRIVQAHRRTGTTGCLPTLITDRTNVVEQVAADTPDSLQIPA